MVISKPTPSNLDYGLSFILDSTFNGFVAIDRKGHICFLNEAAKNLLDLKEDVVGLPVVDIMPETKLMSVLQTGMAQIGLKSLIGDRICLSNLTPILKDDQIMGAIMVFEDITFFRKIVENTSSQHVIEIEQLINKVSTLKDKVKYYKDRLDELLESKYKIDNIIGKSQVISFLRETVGQIAPSSSPVLVRGDSGTGKELFARALHMESMRNQFPFIKVNCSVIPEKQHEHELFGYTEKETSFEKASPRPGKLELANGGTLFLSGIECLSLPVQGRLLQVLQNNELEVAGTKKKIPIDFRLIAATDHNLEDLTKRGLFREDLYYRLNVLRIYIPPLRDRREDIEPLINYMIKKYNKEFGKRVLGISSEVYNILIKHDWPGNVNELEVVMERIIGVIHDQTIQVHDLPLYLKQTVIGNSNTPNGSSLKRIMENAERQAVIEALQRTSGNKVKASRILEISRAGLYQKLEKYKLLDD